MVLKYIKICVTRDLSEIHKDHLEKGFVGVVYPFALGVARPSGVKFIKICVPALRLQAVETTLKGIRVPSHLRACKKRPGAAYCSVGKD